MGFHCPDKKGRYILFKPWMYHNVRKFDYKKERITVAFNCDLTGSILDEQN